MNIQEEIKIMKERIAEFEEQAKEEQEFPQLGDTYWYIGFEGEVLHDEWDGLSSEIAMLEVVSVYKTKEQAEFAVEKLKVESELRKFSRPFEEDEYNCFIQINSSHNIIVVDSDDCYQTQGTIYFESTTIANEAIDTIGTDRIKKYIFGVEG